VLAAAAVIGLHASLGAWLWLSPNAQRLLRPPLESLVLLEPISAPATAHTETAAELPPPDLLPMTLTTPKRPNLPQEPNEIAVSVSAPTEVLIGDANAGEVENLVRGCGGAKARPARPSTRSPEFTLLVRVEKDGRVSDSKIEVGSGAQRVDEAAQRCLLAHGSLTPRRVSGAPVASWQRVHWPAA
jgi:TonB-like protein